MLIVPTYNERNNIEPLVTGIRKSVGSEPILFVDDDSPDGTAAEIRRLQAHDRDIHLLARAMKGGYGSASREAMKQILARNLAEYVIQMDADLSHPPAALPCMIQLLRNHPIVIGSRYVAGGGCRNWDFRRRCLSFGGNLYARLLTGVPVRDLTAGFIGYQTAVLRRIDLDAIRSEGYAFLMEMKFNLYRLGVKFVEFPIVFVERENGRSKFSRAIMMEGARFPLKILARRIRGGR